MRTTVCENGAKLGQKIYTTTNEVDYYNERTGKWKIWAQKKHTTLWDEFKISEAMNNDPADIGRLVMLIENIDRDNFIAVLDKHTRHYIQVSTKKQIMELVQYKSRSKFNVFWKKLEDQNIVASTKVPDWKDPKKLHDRYLVNPMVAMKDRGISPQCYMLFKESLDHLLPLSAREGLRQLYDRQFVQHKSNLDTNILEQPQSEEEKGVIVSEYLYNGMQLPATYAINYQGHKGVARTQFTHDTDLYWTPNAVEGVEGKNSQALESDIKTYRMTYIDIDAGYNLAGNHYLADAEVEERKERMLDILRALPTATAIVKTRNGVQAYWSLVGIESLDQWKQLENRIVNMVSIADTGVKNVNRLLRVPGSTWNKATYKAEASGCAAYRTQIVEANRQEWDFDSLMSQLDNAEAAVERASDTYITLYGMPVEKVKKTAAKKTATAGSKPRCKSATAPSASQQADANRIEAISKLSTATFNIPDQPTFVPDYADHIRRHVDMADFLAISNPDNFCDIFHQDNNPSATIYANGDGSWKYVCSSAPVAGMEQGMSLIDIVCELANCTPAAAIKYIATVCNLRYVRSSK